MHRKKRSSIALLRKIAQIHERIEQKISYALLSLNLFSYHLTGCYALAALGGGGGVNNKPRPTLGAFLNKNCPTIRPLVFMKESLFGQEFMKEMFSGTKFPKVRQPYLSLYRPTRLHRLAESIPRISVFIFVLLYSVWLCSVNRIICTLHNKYFV
jgi:hypothetical protein